MIQLLLIGLTITSTPTEAPRPECAAWVDHLTRRARRAETQRDGALADWSRDLESYDALVHACEAREAALEVKLAARVAPAPVVVDGSPGPATAALVAGGAILLGAGALVGARQLDLDASVTSAATLGATVIGALVGLAVSSALGI